MELESIKKSWEQLDNKLKKASEFNHKLVETIISSRVMTTVDKIRKMNRMFFVVLTIELLFMVAVFAGNPFDFKYKLQFIPYGLLFIGIAIAFLNLLHQDSALNKLSPDIRIDQYLNGIVTLYNKNKRFEKWFGVIFLSIGLLVPLSFLPQKIERLGLTKALLDIGIMISVTLVIYLMAFKFGAFKNRNRDKLEQDLAEWKELNALAGEMNNG